MLGWIHRVPRVLRKLNEAAYTPHLVSIGPFHYGKPEFKSMEDHKAKYQEEFWKRSFCNHLNVNNVIEDFMKQKDRIGRIRRCYAGTFEQLADDVLFSKAILKDACFIFELFLRNSERKPDDYILSTPWLKKRIELDLMLLENQLPFFVFTELFDFILLDQQLDGGIPDHLSKFRDKSEPGVLELAILFFFYYYPKGIPFDNKKMEGWKEIKHFTDLVRLFMYPKICNNPESSSSISSNSEKKEEDEGSKKIKHCTDLVRKFLCPKEYSSSISCCYSAKKLDRAGVNFVSRTNHYLADVVLKDYNKYKCIPCMALKVEIPKLSVDHTTECVMRNVMALEQCIYPCEPRICNYIYLLDQLIDTAEDVELLVEKSIIENLLGSNDAVAVMFNKLCDQNWEKEFFYGDLCYRLNKHYHNCCSSSKETLKRVYFKDLWTGSSTVVGLFVFIFSVVSVISIMKDLIPS